VGDDTITHLATCAFDFAIPTLNSAATLKFAVTGGVRTINNRPPR
jgi:hypothetical protein